MKYFLFIAFTFIIGVNFHCQTRVSKMQLSGHILYHFKATKNGYYPERTEFENDTSSYPFIGSCLEKISFIESLNLVNMNFKYDSSCTSIFDEDSTNNIEKTFAIKRTSNKGGIIKVISPHYFQNYYSDSIVIAFKITGTFLLFENLVSPNQKIPKSILALEKIENITGPESDFLKRKALVKKNIIETIYFVDEY